MYVLVFNCYCIAGSDLFFVHSAIDPCCFLFGNHQSLLIYKRGTERENKDNGILFNVLLSYCNI